MRISYLAFLAPLLVVSLFGCSKDKERDNDANQKGADQRTSPSPQDQPNSQSFPEVKLRINQLLSPGLLTGRFQAIKAIFPGISEVYLSRITAKRFQLGAYDYTFGVAPIKSWDDVSIQEWLKAIQPICTSPELESFYQWSKKDSEVPIETLPSGISKQQSKDTESDTKIDSDRQKRLDDLIAKDQDAKKQNNGDDDSGSNRDETTEALIDLSDFPKGPLEFVQASYGRTKLLESDLEMINAIEKLTTDNEDRMGLLCLTVLSSMEYNLR